MKIISTFFFLFIFISAFAQEKKDSVERRKFSIYFSGGINQSKILYNDSRYRNAKNPVNEFYELDCTYGRASIPKVSLGIAYYHFSDYTDTYYGFNDFKMLLIPVHLLIQSNENKKIFLLLYTGPEIGFILKEADGTYVNNKFYFQDNLQYSGIGIFFTIGANINYSINKYIAMGLGASYTIQTDPFYYSSSSNTLTNESLSIIYTSFNINIRYKFK